MKVGTLNCIRRLNPGRRRCSPLSILLGGAYFPPRGRLRSSWHVFRGHDDASRFLCELLPDQTRAAFYRCAQTYIRVRNMLNAHLDWHRSSCEGQKIEPRQEGNACPGQTCFRECLLRRAFLEGLRAQVCCQRLWCPSINECSAVECVCQHIHWRFCVFAVCKGRGRYVFFGPGEGVNGVVVLLAWLGVRVRTQPPGGARVGTIKTPPAPGEIGRASCRERV